MTVLMRVKTGLGIAGAAFALSVAAPANAATIVGVYNTGVDNNGNVLAPGAAEQHYQVVSTTHPTLVTPTTPTVVQYSQWSANDAAGSPGSAWISPFHDGSGGAGDTGTPFGTAITYSYLLNFSIGSLSAATAMISGEVQSDNFVQVFLNGVEVGGQTPDFSQPYDSTYFRKFTAFDSTGGLFNEGPGNNNTLEFRVTDFGVVSGLRVNNLVGTAVPEPGVWAMLIVGFGLVAGQIRRRRRAGPLAIA